MFELDSQFVLGKVANINFIRILMITEIFQVNIHVSLYQ